jgi:prophage regulatory protein
MSTTITKDVTERPLMTRREILEIVPVNSTTLWRWVRKGSFPKPINQDGGKLLWSKESVEAWIGAPL